MMLSVIQVGSFEVNCSILAEGGRAWIVDPGQDGARIIALLGERQLTPAAVLLTHAHFDHIGAIPALQEVFHDLPIFVGAADTRVIDHPLNQLPPAYPTIKTVSGLQPLAHDGPIDLCGLEVELIATPGHTPGGICYYLKGFRDTRFAGTGLLLSGDTLFASSVGRTDLPGGDMATLMASLEKLKVLPGETTVVPGHGPLTTIADELRANPFLQ